MGSIRRVLSRGRVAWLRYSDILWSIPFLQPRITQIIYATFAGVFLSIGTDLLVTLAINRDVSWNNAQTAGVLFIVASLFLSGLAWSAQSFLDYLVRQGKDRDGASERSVAFLAWPQRYWAWVLFLFAFISFGLALRLLVTGRVI